MSEWVVLELSSKAEGEDPDFIRASIRHMIRDADVYLPVSVTKVGEDRVINYLVDGYAFIRRAHPDDKYFKLEGTRYVQQIISQVGRGANGRSVRVLSCVSDVEIDRFRQQIHAEENQGIGIGDTIVVTSGPYRQIQATVIEDIPERESVMVHIKLRSKEDIVTLPRSFLHLVQRATKSPYLERVEILRAWFESIRPLLLAPPKQLFGILEAHGGLLRLQAWVDHRNAVEDFFRLSGGPQLGIQPVLALADRFGFLDRAVRGISQVRALMAAPADPHPIRSRWLGMTRLDAWGATWKALVPDVQKLHSILTPAYSSRPFDPVQAKYMSWVWHEDISERLGTLRNELEAIEQSMTEPMPQVDTVIVDGHNLAIRCASVPGLDLLKDSKGRLTGAIVGTLRSLGSFRKRFPGAEIIVVWDGSSQRRKKEFPDYKANRTPRAGTSFSDEASSGTPFDPIRWLREVLPYLGVKQAWNPEEEADDVMATLTRKLSGKNLVLVTNDRDMLQLVSASVHMFVPGKDRLFDSAAVEAEYGVRPDHMVDLRALDGDSSDNIPGVPGFGLKTAAKLLRLYGSIDGVYKSNFSGVTPSQYKKLRESERQVRLNVQLMSLHHDVGLMLVDSNPDHIVAAERLKDVDVKYEPIIEAMLSRG